MTRALVVLTLWISAAMRSSVARLWSTAGDPATKALLFEDANQRSILSAANDKSELAPRSEKEGRLIWELSLAQNRINSTFCGNSVTLVGLSPFLENQYPISPMGTATGGLCLSSGRLSLIAAIVDW